METSAWVELFGSAVIEGFILGALLALVWSMATKVLQWFLIGQFVLLKWLESRDIVTVDWERLTLGLIENSTALTQEALTILESTLELGAYGLSIPLGFALVKKIRS
jgi:uncharacterized membrane protein (Fun14 family)